MSKTALFPVILAGALGLAGCTGGLVPYAAGPNTVIASSTDTGTDNVGIADGDAAVVYDPDGCQGWLIDDGVEGYSGRRYDPVTGLPVCNGLFPPGTVVGDYQSTSRGVGDFTPAQ